MNGLVINLTHSVDDVDRTSVAMVVAGASVASDQKTTVFLSSEGTRLAAKGVAEDLHEEGFAPMSELVSNYVAAGGTFLVCSPCAKKRDIGEDDLIEGASVVGGATLVALLADGAASLSF
ncbi:DsrE family protein [Nocardioides donggukensis]|uniref:DsrE family protein n=1 Tax=Nocardioides donggukensis TaxID=2774019 RepID=A0A927KB46_9ACTN|nr:DsrE family protein [Nocardioides donggukensis]MBD8871061.1 DsrE family protein [Nocardioides donggukensis]